MKTPGPAGQHLTLTVLLSGGGPTWRGNPVHVSSWASGAKAWPSGDLWWVAHIPGSRFPFSMWGVLMHLLFFHPFVFKKLKKTFQGIMTSDFLCHSIPGFEVCLCFILACTYFLSCFISYCTNKLATVCFSHLSRQYWYEVHWKSKNIKQMFSCSLLFKKITLLNSSPFELIILLTQITKFMQSSTQGWMHIHLKSELYFEISSFASQSKLVLTKSVHHERCIGPLSLPRSWSAGLNLIFSYFQTVIIFSCKRTIWLSYF